MPCHGVQSLQGHFLRLAHIDPVELSTPLAIGAPVPVATLIARTLATHGKGSERTAHAEVSGCLQPGIPGGGSHLQPTVVSVSLIDQGLAFYESRGLVLVAHAHHQRGSNTQVPEQYSTCSEPLWSGEPDRM